jgi:hypothetical protein
MSLSLESLTNHIISNGDESAKSSVIKTLTDGIINNKGEKYLCKKLYKEVYGCTLIPELCDELIASLHQGTEHGSKWSKSDCETVANKLGYKLDIKPYTIHEFRAAMHVCYYMMNTPLKDSGITVEPTGWGRCANFYFTSDDSFKDKLVGFYFSKLHNLE